MHPDKNTNVVIPQRPQQTFIVFNILALTLCSATSSGLYRAENYSYLFYPLSVPGLLLILILTEKKGRKVLSITLFSLCLLSSITYLFRYREICTIVLAPVQGAAVALLSLVICEYSDPKRRFFFLMANSAIQIFCDRVTLVLWFDKDILVLFGHYLQYFNICLGAIGLYAVFKWPESPYWLSSKGKFEESARAFVAVRGGNSDSSEELRALTDPRPRPASNRLFCAPILIALPILCMSIFSIDIAYLYDTITYTLTSTETLTTIETYWLFVALKCIVAIASVTSVLIPFKISRKVLFSSCAILFLANIYVVEVMLQTPEISFFILGVIFDTVVDYGPRTVALPLLVELIPQQYSTIITAIISVMYFIIELCAFNFNIPTLPFSLFILVSVVICYVLMPEAKNKTLLQIEQSYVPKKKDAPQLNQTDL